MNLSQVYNLFLLRLHKIRRKYLITITVGWLTCLIVFVLIFTLILIPQSENKKQLLKQVEEKKQRYDIAKEDSQEQGKAKLNKELEELQNKLAGFVADYEDSANLTFDISKIANEKSISSFGLKTRDNQPIPNCNYINYNYIYVTFETGFSQFATFINALERHQPVIFVDKFTITRSEQNISNYTVNMDLSVFVRKR